ncbi:MAG: acylneuraminate cytidylyltransferase family protein [Caldimonas sp.]
MTKNWLPQRILGLIPARGGSKGIPRKNIKLIAGKPLIAWTIEAALQSTKLHDVVVTTDDAEIAEIARAFGARTPFMRPADLARDETPGVDPVLHALTVLSDFDTVVLLQPTSPLRQAQDIDAGIALGAKLDAPCVVSVCEPNLHPNWMYRLDDGQRLHSLLDTPRIRRRQELSPVFAANGAVYVANARWLCESKDFITDESVGYVMPRERSVDLDSLLDWKLAELLLQERLG